MRLAIAEAEELQLVHRGFGEQPRVAQLDSWPIQACATRISRTRRIPGVRWTLALRERSSGARAVQSGKQLEDEADGQQNLE